jgi:DnaJ-class molecular chaperone
MLKTVRDLGMPFYEKNFAQGNLYLNFNIVFPAILDTTQKELITKVKIIKLKLRFYLVKFLSLYLRISKKSTLQLLLKQKMRIHIIWVERKNVY